MKSHPLRYAKIIVGLILLLLAAANSVVVSAQERAGVEFTNVREGETISRLTTLTGTVNFPDFLKYEIFLKSGDNLIWAGNSYSRIVNGNLIRLDPRVFASGPYQLLVRQVNLDSNYTDVLGPNIIIDNPNKVPLPYYPEVEPSFLYPSEIFAVVRVRNCAGEDFNFDYHSPQDGRSSDDTKLSGKIEGGICAFQDLALIPGLYRGTAQGGSQGMPAPFELLVDEWKVYELAYFGGVEIHAGEVQADAQAGDGRGAMLPGDGRGAMAPPPPAFEPQPTTMPQPRQAPAAPPTPASGASKPKAILPTTGLGNGVNILFGGIALAVILILSLGGVLATRRR